MKGEYINEKYRNNNAYASAWIATSIAVIFAIKYTGSIWCLWALLFPACINASVDISTSDKGDDNEEE